MAVGMDVELAGVAFQALTEEETVDRVRTALAQGTGGRILTPNVDILRQDPAPYAADASLVVADGMPLVWASRLAGRPLPERVAGSSLIWSLSRALSVDGRSAFLLGGGPPSGWARAADALRATCPALRVAGLSPGQHAPDRVVDNSSQKHLDGYVLPGGWVKPQINGRGGAPAKDFDDLIFSNRGGVWCRAVHWLAFFERPPAEGARMMVAPN